MVRVLFIGDIVGKPGRRAVRELLPSLKVEYNVDFVVANVENAAGGAGITQNVAKELRSYGINAMTGGNHIWAKREIFKFIDNFPELVRPLNHPESVPGQGVKVFTSDTGVPIAVINLMGRLFLQCLDNPFIVLERTLEALKTKIIIVDFHAEATAEKQAFALYFDGKVSAIIGTHTHVQTSDERILPNGTAYITDVGMAGGLGGVIGVKKEAMIKKFLTGLPVDLEASKEQIGLEAAFIEIDPTSGKALRIERIRRFLK
ncbi:MAG: TIGR00282 family metallophosphoesterase [Candidatus Hydrothermota bacterium]|nr:MAG: TIGR00282 family metallophosphoesterase [Candidatus Hydrothermae bacterium]